MQNQSASYTASGFWVDPQYLYNGQAPEAVESWYYAYQITVRGLLCLFLPCLLPTCPSPVSSPLNPSRSHRQNDRYWRDVSWAYTLGQNRTERAGSGFSSVNNVFLADGGGTQNFMASYMLAEVLKYQYLVQTEKKGEWHVENGGVNAFVYNTEAHPIRVGGAKPI